MAMGMTVRDEEVPKMMLLNEYKQCLRREHTYKIGKAAALYLAVLLGLLPLPKDRCTSQHADISPSSGTSSDVLVLQSNPPPHQLLQPSAHLVAGRSNK